MEAHPPVCDGVSKDVFIYLRPKRELKLASGADRPGFSTSGTSLEDVNVSFIITLG